MGDVSRYKLVVYLLISANGRAYFCKSIAIEMGGVSRHFSRISGSGVNVTLLNPSLEVGSVPPTPDPVFPGDDLDLSQGQAPFVLNKSGLSQAPSPQMFTTADGKTLPNSFAKDL